jgi:hypothetical protein
MTRRRRTPPVFEIERRTLPPKQPRPSLRKTPSHEEGVSKRPKRGAHEEPRFRPHPSPRPAREVRCRKGTAPRGSHEEPQDAPRPIDFAAAVAQLEGALARGEAPRLATSRDCRIDPTNATSTTHLSKPRPLAGAPRLRTTKWF